MLFSPYCLYILKKKSEINENLEPVNEDDSKNCIICYERPSNYAAVPCGHKNYC